MSEPLRCAECKVELTTADADDLVATDAGPVHRECYEGPVPEGGPSAAELLDAAEGPTIAVGKFGSVFRCTAEEGWTVNGQPYNPDEDGVHQEMTPEEEEAENERRREMGDPPLPPPIRFGTHAEYIVRVGPGPFPSPTDEEYAIPPEEIAERTIDALFGEALPRIPAGYLLPPGKTMADVRTMDEELLALEGLTPPGDFDELAGAKVPLCPECNRAPAVEGGRCWECRGKSMLP